MRSLPILGALAALAVPWQVQPSTLVQLSLDDLILKSTAIVRGVAQPGQPAFRGSVIYTHYRLQVTETWKGSVPATVDVAVPGGAASGLRQTYSGAPALNAGQPYVLFLWTSRTGLTQVIGLSQGLFNLSVTAQGETVVTRAASSEPMLTSTGQPAADTAFQMRLADFRSRVARTLAARGAR